MDGGERVLETRDLGYAYVPEVFALRHLNLEVRRGEILGLLGRNGAGKTTTLRILTSLLEPTEGEAYLFGTEVRRAGRDVRQRLGIVLQQDSFDFVSVERNLRLYAFLRGVSREAARTRAEEMIDLFELEPYRGSYPWSLSGGARRRLQVARELMTDAELLFLDEPTVGLDAMVRRSILGYLHRRARAGTAIVFTTHVLQEADQLCDRIAVLDRGRLVATASPEELKRHYGGARVVELEFEDGAPEADAAALIAELEGLGRDFALLERTGGRFRFRASNPEELVARTSRWGLARGNELRRLSVREATLEEAFVGLISGDGAATNGTDDAGSPGRDPP